MATRKTGPGLHAHGCPQCKERYEDACDTPNENARCSFCRIGHGWELLRESRRPKDCCKIHSRPVEKNRQMNTDEWKKYSLSTSIDWFICVVCARTHPYKNPTKEQR